MRSVIVPPWGVEGILPGIAIAAALCAGPLLGWAIAGEQWNLVVLVALGAISPIVLRWPVVVGFGTYAFLVPFDSVAAIADLGGATLTKLIGALAVGVLLATILIQRRLVQPPFAAACLGLFLLWVVLSFVWAINLDMARSRLPTTLSLAALYFVAVSYRVSQRELQVVCLLIAIGGVLASAGGIIMSSLANTQDTVRGTLAVGGERANPNGVAQGLLLPLAIAVGIFLRSRRAIAAAASITGIVAIAAGIFLTVSRGALLALAIMTCILLYRFRARWQILLVVCILAALLPLMPDIFFERINMLISGEDTTGSGRTDIWNIGLRGLEQFGLFGAGLSNFPAVYELYAPTPPGALARGSHNTYLMVSIELGVIGLALFLMVVIAHLRMANWQRGLTSSRALPASIEAACVACLVIGLFGDVLWTKAFWTPMILMVWANRSLNDTAAP
jgi:O-antigen ligase